MESGIFFGNPVPAESSISKVQMDALISRAVEEAGLSGIHGSDNTPFVLNRIRELSKGQSVIANRALVESNVARATKVAVHVKALTDPDAAM